MITRILLTVAIWAALGAGAAPAQVIVVNSGVKIEAISKSDLRDIFLGTASSFKDGSRAVPVTLRTGPAQETFLKNLVGKNQAGFLAAWRAVVFAGQGVMPKSFDTESALLDYVASVPGAIGYIEAPTGHDKVRSLTVR